MEDNFVENPFCREILRVNSIYRSTSRHHFFITFRDEEKISEPQMINTLGNNLALSVATSSTVWNPPFKAMKFLLLRAVQFDEEISDQDRKALLNSNKDRINVSTMTFDKFTYSVILDNKNEEIILKKQ